MSNTTRPAQLPTELSRPFWEAASRGQLVLQCCSACGTIRHYPRLLCDRCYGDAAHWVPASGNGTIHSWTVAHYAYHPSFAAELPYVLVTVDLAEGVRALGRWRGAPALALGLPVQGRFAPRDDGVDLVFEPLAG